MQQQMHPSKVVQCKVYVHDLVLVLINKVLIPRLQHRVAMILHVSLNPSPHVGLELEMVHTSVGWKVSNFHSEISSCDLQFIQLLTDNILVPFLEGYQKENHQNYNNIREYYNKTHARFFERQVFHIEYVNVFTRTGNLQKVYLLLSSIVFVTVWTEHGLVKWKSAVHFVIAVFLKGLLHLSPACLVRRLMVSTLI